MGLTSQPASMAAFFMSPFVVHAWVGNLGNQRITSQIGRAVSAESVAGPQLAP